MGSNNTSGGNSPHVTIVIPARNSTQFLGDQLAAIAEQTYQGSLDVVVSDNGSTDGLPEYVDTHPLKDALSLTVVDSSGTRGAAHARNVGAEHATGDFLAFCDADDRVHPKWLQRLVEEAQDCDITTTALEGDSLNPPNARYVAMIAPPDSFQPALAWPVTIGGSIGIWRSAWESIGGMNEAFLANQDVEFGWRAQQSGHTLKYIPEALVAYRYRNSARQSWRQGLRRGRSLEQLRVAFPDSGLPPNRILERLNNIAHYAIRSPLLPNKLFAITFEEWALIVGLQVGGILGGITYKTLRL